MKQLLSLLLTVSLALSAGGCGQSGSPDTVFVGGVVHTGVEGRETAEAVSVKNGRVHRVGTKDELLSHVDRGVRVIDLEGAHLYPGFTDSHLHLLGVGERELQLNLDSVDSIEELVRVVADSSRDLPTGQVLFGRGWIETQWPERRFPSRHDIDAVSADRPVVLVRADGHALLANSAALRAAKIDLDRPIQPDGGRVELDASGSPTGLLVDNAMNLVSGLTEERTGRDLEFAYERAGAVLVGLGWTGVHNMSARARHVPVLNELSEAGRLPLRVYNAVDGAEAGDFPEDVFGRSPRGLVTTRAIKLYMDGALGSRGALLGQPYSDSPDQSGLQLADEDQTIALLGRALRAGVQVSFHAIGDRANSLVLNWMERAFSDIHTLPPDKRDPRWRIEHAQVLSPQDIARIPAMGIIPSMQPSHAIGDLHFAPARLGPVRLEGAYAWRSILDAGGIIAGGSDAPVEKGDPLIEYYAAVARKDVSGFSGSDWRPEQKVTRSEALKMFTIWPAYASFREDDLGTIEAGKIADFSVFSGDLLTVAEADILSLKPVMTVVEGAIVWAAKSQ